MGTVHACHWELLPPGGRWTDAKRLTEGACGRWREDTQVHYRPLPTLVDGSAGKGLLSL